MVPKVEHVTPPRRGGYRPGSGPKLRYGEKVDFSMRVPKSRVAKIRTLISTRQGPQFAALLAVIAQWQALSVRSRSTRGVEQLLAELEAALNG
jgi:hypothetical protein